MNVHSLKNLFFVVFLSPMRQLRPLQLAAIIFLTVSGGPYGLESLFTYVGNQGALLLFVSRGL